MERLHFDVSCPYSVDGGTSSKVFLFSVIIEVRSGEALVLHSAEKLVNYDIIFPCAT